MSALTDSINHAIGTALAFAGEPIKIYPFQGDAVTVNAIVTGGSFDRIGVPGGFYDEMIFTAAIRKIDLILPTGVQFVPQPGMLVDARDSELRIDNNGVTFFRVHYRLQLVSRTAIK